MAGDAPAVGTDARRPALPRGTTGAARAHEPASHRAGSPDRATHVRAARALRDRRPAGRCGDPCGCGVSRSPAAAAGPRPDARIPRPPRCDGRGAASQHRGVPALRRALHLPRRLHGGSRRAAPAGLRPRVAVPGLHGTTAAGIAGVDRRRRPRAVPAGAGAQRVLQRNATLAGRRRSCRCAVGGRGVRRRHGRAADDGGDDAARRGTGGRRWRQRRTGARDRDGRQGRRPGVPAVHAAVLPVAAAWRSDLVRRGRASRRLHARVRSPRHGGLGHTGRLRRGLGGLVGGRQGARGGTQARSRGAPVPAPGRSRWRSADGCGSSTSGSRRRRRRRGARGACSASR